MFINLLGLYVKLYDLVRIKLSPLFHFAHLPTSRLITRFVFHYFRPVDGLQCMNESDYMRIMKQRTKTNQFVSGLWKANSEIG